MRSEARAFERLAAAVLFIALLGSSVLRSRAEPRASTTLGPAVAGAEDTRRDRIYLAELALLLEGSRRLLAYGEAHSEHHADGSELARFAYPLAERYVELASRMLPAPKLAVVHPHLLLLVENLERALDAAATADAASYQKRMRIAREELSNLEAVLKQLKLRLPELPR